MLTKDTRTKSSGAARTDFHSNMLLSSRAKHRKQQHPSDYSSADPNVLQGKTWKKYRWSVFQMDTMDNVNGTYICGISRAGVLENTHV